MQYTDEEKIIQKQTNIISKSTAPIGIALINSCVLLSPTSVIVLILRFNVCSIEQPSASLDSPTSVTFLQALRLNFLSLEQPFANQRIPSFVISLHPCILLISNDSSLEQHRPSIVISESVMFSQ